MTKISTAIINLSLIDTLVLYHLLDTLHYFTLSSKLDLSLSHINIHLNKQRTLQKWIFSK